MIFAMIKKCPKVFRKKLTLWAAGIAAGSVGDGMQGTVM